MIKSSSSAPFLFFSVLSLLFLNSCSNTTEKTDVAQASSDSAKATASKDTAAKETRLFSLPAPMQVANAIKRGKSKYSEDYLLPLSKTGSSDFQKKVSLGMLAVDLGYANVYDQKQTSINYFAGSFKLADELHFLGSINPETIKSFKNNIANTDSVTFFTLSTFQKINRNLMDNNRSTDAYLVLTGSFIEGVYLSSKVYSGNKDKSLIQIVGEQKLYLDNILQLLNGQDDKDVVTLVASLNKLKTVYDKVDISYKAGTDAETQDIMPITVSEDILKEISDTVSSIRTDLTK